MYPEYRIIGWKMTATVEHIGNVNALLSAAGAESTGKET